MTDFIVKTFIRMFSLSLQMSAPIVVAMFFTDLGLGLLARVAPQFNIFCSRRSRKIIIGLLLLILLFPGFIGLFEDLFKTMLDSMQKLILLLRAD